MNELPSLGGILRRRSGMCGRCPVERIAGVQAAIGEYHKLRHLTQLITFP